MVPSAGSGSTHGIAAVEALRLHPVILRVAEVTRGVPTHLVGGMIRDAWLGRTTQDLDVVVASRGRELARRLAAVLPARFVDLGGKEFAAFRLVGRSFQLDLWDRDGMTLAEDLARRDFTVNAIALDLGRQGPAGLLDPHSGIQDLQHRLLRATTPKSFSDDPLRVLRLPRFAAQLPGFSAEAETRELARRAAPALRRMAAERIREELARILAAPGASRGFEEMVAVGLYPRLLLGDLADLELRAAAGAEAAASRIVRELEALPPVATRLAALIEEAGLEAVPELDLAAARLASMVLDIPGEEPTALLRHLHEVGYISRRTLDPVIPLLKYHRLPTSETGGVLERRRFLHHMGRLWRTALALLGAQAYAQGSAGLWEASVVSLLELLHREGEQILDPPRLLTGDEVSEILALGPGPEIGRALAALRQAQVDGHVRTRGEALRWIRASVC